MLTGLGNGFALENSGDNPILLGGGLGTAPLYWLCRALAERGVRPTVAMGFDTAESIYYADRFPAAGAREVLVATMDGTAGVKGDGAGRHRGLKRLLLLLHLRPQAHDGGHRQGGGH